MSFCTTYRVCLCWSWVLVGLLFYWYTTFDYTYLDILNWYYYYGSIYYYHLVSKFFNLLKSSLYSYLLSFLFTLFYSFVSSLVYAFTYHLNLLEPMGTISRIQHSSSSFFLFLLLRRISILSLNAKPLMTFLSLGSSSSFVLK